MLKSNAINLTAIYIDDTSNSTQPFKPAYSFSLSFYIWKMEIIKANTLSLSFISLKTKMVKMILKKKMKIKINLSLLI